MRPPSLLRLYTLTADGTPVRCHDLLAWAQWMDEPASHAQRVVAKTRDGDAEVSTVFLGHDHNHSGIGPPILWESRVFGGPLDAETWRYVSHADAVAGHQQLCQRVVLARQVDGIGGFK